jgi:hypothetical protein
MSEIIHRKETNLTQIGNSIGVILPKIYREMAGMEEKEQDIEIASIWSPKYGIFLGQWITGQQPSLGDIDTQKLRQIIKENTESDSQ